LADAVLDPGVLAVAQFQARELTGHDPVGRVGDKPGDAVSVGIGESQLRPGVGTFLAQDQPGPVRPGRQVHQCGGVGHPGAVADAAVGLDRRIPRAGGVEHLGGVTDAGVDRAAKGEPDVLFPAGGGEAVSGAGRVGADQNLGASRFSGSGRYRSGTESSA
jgi:hypothetical protein